MIFFNFQFTPVINSRQSESLPSKIIYIYTLQVVLCICDRAGLKFWANTLYEFIRNDIQAKQGKLIKRLIWISKTYVTKLD